MGRQARKLSKTGIYHILFRGVNHCHLFEENADFEKFLSILKTVKSELPFELYAYVLMSNHVHLILREIAAGDIMFIMKKILTQYAGWFNRKYGRSGALISNRYKSECAEDDAYLLSLVRYIHQNPLKAGAAKDLESYKWSSYREYLHGADGIAETGFVLNMMAGTDKSALDEFVAFHLMMSTEPAGNITMDGTRKTETQLYDEAVGVLNCEPNAIAGMTKAERNAAITLLRANGFSVRQRERLTGVSRSVVGKCRKKTGQIVPSPVSLPVSLSTVPCVPYCVPYLSMLANCRILPSPTNEAICVIAVLFNKESRSD
jgi:REP element-mobilizing transposase RayT